MTKLFLSLDDAVLVATRGFNIDPQLARQEFEQKCNQYVIGYYDGLNDAIKAIEDKAESEDGND